MRTILHIDSSPRTTLSGSRLLTREFVDAIVQTVPETTVVYRDLAVQTPALVNEPWISATFTPAEQRMPEMHAALRESDALIDEMMAADLIVIGVPMHNLGVCTLLKCYIDQIVRAGRTFQFTAEGPRGLVTGKQVVFVTTRGSDYSTSPMSFLDFQQPYLKTIFGFIGIEDVSFISCNGMDAGNRDQAVDEARQAIQSLLGRLVGVGDAQMALSA